MPYKHAVIAGVNKCGTTSVFRYLADHPEVCGSSIKELRFFLQESYDESKSTIEEYRSHFASIKSGDVLLEASPSYFSWGEDIANRIRRLIPAVRIIVMLRNPVERLYSYYRSALVYDNYANALLSDISFPDFVDMALAASADSGQTDPQRAEFRRALHQGRYVHQMETFGSQFPNNQICYLFFEDLAKNPCSVMKLICEFLEIDEAFFDTYDFRIENKTRSFRSMRLQKLGFRVNMRFEKLFNRHPELRRVAQSLYRWVNEKREQTDAPTDTEAFGKLQAYYRVENQRLRGMLIGHGCRPDFPSWVP